MATIRITNLRLRTIIGIHDWEREHKQDIVINISIEYDAAKACDSDDIGDTLDYKTITKRIVKEAEASSYFLLEKIAKTILNICLDYAQVEKATVRVDKPFALRFADSVSIELSEKKK